MTENKEMNCISRNSFFYLILLWAIHMFYSQQLYLIAFDDMYLNVKLKRCRVKKKTDAG